MSLGEKAQVIEVGIRSTVGIQVSGLCNFRNCKAFKEVDYLACEKYAAPVTDSEIRDGGLDGLLGAAQEEFAYRTDRNGGDGKDVVPTVQYQNGTLQLKLERYSFWLILWRRAGTDNYIKSDNIYGVRSSTLAPIYNYLRLVFPDSDEWEFTFRPVSGKQALEFDGKRLVIDYRLPERKVVDNGITVWFNGEGANDKSAFRVGLFEYDGSNSDYGNPPDPKDPKRTISPVALTTRSLSTALA